MIQTGDILYSSWGYEQTNATFYRVTARKGKRVYLQPLETIVTESGPLSMTGHGVPGDAEGATFYRNIRDGYAGGTTECIKVHSYEYAYPWDGTPRSCSWYG